MNTRSTVNAVQVTLTRLDKFGATMPKAVRQKLDDGIEHARAALAWRPSEAGDLTEHVYAALVAGRDPGTDERVQRALLTDRLLTIRELVYVRAGQHLAALVHDHLEQIVDAMDAAYQQHAVEPLSRARETLGACGIDRPDTDPALVLKQGPQAAAAWATVLSAVDAHRQIVTAYTQFRAPVGIGAGADSMFLYLDPGDLDLIAVRNLGSQPHPWAALNAGCQLSITTPAGAVERQNRAAELTARATAERADAFVREYKRTHGVGVVA
jgi:hypothetical protein